jgi:Glycosyl hydrolases family 39
MPSRIADADKKICRLASLILIPVLLTASRSHAQNTVSINYSQTGNVLVRLNQNVSTIQASNGPQDDQLVKNLGMRLERTFWSPAVWAQAGPGQYNFTAANPFTGSGFVPVRDWGADSPMLDNIIAQGAQPVISFSGEPVWDASSSGVTGQLDDLPVNTSEYQQLVKDGLNHLRSKYPGIRYIEVWNEPDNDNMTPAQYEAFYQSVAQAVQAVNASLPSGQLPFLIGGPAVYQPTSALMSSFISFVKAQNVELDFLSWHEYGGNVWSDAQALQSKLSSAGLNPNLPQFVTEWGFTSANETSAPTPSQLMSSATYISQGWTELETDGLASVVTPFPFSEDDYVGFYRSMLLPYQQNPEDGQVFPLYNVYQMMAMQKNTLVASSGISGGTTSLFPLATEDSSGVALMLTNTAGSTVTVNFNNLPSAFQQGAFQLTEYLVDGTHSNWAYNQSTATLQQVADASESAASSFSTTVTMAQDSVVLLVLTPTASSGGGSNLIQDPGFEASSSLAPYWKVDGAPSASGVDTVAAHAHSGSHSGYIYDGSGTKKFVDLSQTVAVSANTSYTLTGWVDASDTTGGLFGVRTTGGSNIATSALSNTDPGPSTHSADYQQYTVTFNSGGNTSVVVFAGYTTPGTASFINADDFSMVANESTAPAAPTNLAATAGNGSVSLSWKASSGAVSYNVYRGTVSGQETVLVSGLSSTSYADGSVANGTTYFYEVTAVNGAGESGRSNEVKATPANAGSNLVQDPGFEASSSLAPYWSVAGAPTGAGVDVTSAHAHSGSHSAYIYDDSGSSKFVLLSQTVAVVANASYTLTGWIDASGTTGGLFGVRTTGGTNIATTALSNTDPGPSTHSTDYKQYTVTFNSGSNTSVVVFAGYTTPGTGSFINLDDVSLLSP